jgi:hypothetical protein
MLRQKIYYSRPEPKPVRMFPTPPKKILEKCHTLEWMSTTLSSGERPERWVPWFVISVNKLMLCWDGLGYLLRDEMPNRVPWSEGQILAYWCSIWSIIHSRHSSERELTIHQVGKQHQSCHWYKCKGWTPGPCNVEWKKPYVIILFASILVCPHGVE